MKTSLMTTFLAMTVVMTLASSAQALTEIYRGQSDFGDEDTGKACVLTIDRDEKNNNIVALKIEAPARLQKIDASDEMDFEEITTGKEGKDLSRTKRFSEYRFQKLADIQGEGVMLRGEKIQKSKKNEKLFIHFDIREGALVGVQFAQREILPASKGKASLEKICSSLKKQ